MEALTLVHVDFGPVLGDRDIISVLAFFKQFIALLNSAEDVQCFARCVLGRSSGFVIDLDFDRLNDLLRDFGCVVHC
jgi:hypothetical protein